MRADTAEITAETVITHLAQTEMAEREEIVTTATASGTPATAIHKPVLSCLPCGGICFGSLQRSRFSMHTSDKGPRRVGERRQQQQARRRGEPSQIDGSCSDLCTHVLLIVPDVDRRREGRYRECDAHGMQ